MRQEDRAKQASNKAAGQASKQPPKFEERQRADDAGTGAEVRGYEKTDAAREEPHQQRGQQRPNWDNDLMPRDPDPRSDDGANGTVPEDERDHDRAYGWSGGRGEERSARERELTEHDADKARNGESTKSSSEERRDDTDPEDPDTDASEREDTKPR